MQRFLRHMPGAHHGGMGGGLPHVDLVAVHPHARQRRPRALQPGKARLRAAHRLARLEQRHQRQQPDARPVAPRATRFHAIQVDHGLAQHLQPAAHPQHLAATHRVLTDGRIQPLAAQPLQIGRGALAARQDDPVLRPQRRQLPCLPHPAHAHTGQLPQGFKLIQIADARIGHDGHGHRSLLASGGRIIENAILFRQAMAAPHGQRRQYRHTSHLLQHLRRGRQQAGIAAELVQHEAAQQCPVRFRHQRPSAIQVGKGAAAINIGHQQAGCLRMARHAQIDDIAAHQVDLGRRTRPLDHHHIILGAQCIKRRGNLRPDLFAASAPGHGRQLRVHLPQHYHLAARIRLGLEQQRVHAHLGLGMRCQRLEILRAADLAAVRTGGRATDHARVVAHVLRLERHHTQALPCIPAAQRRRQPALAGAAGASQHHHAASKQAAGTLCALRGVGLHGHLLALCALS